MPGRFNVEAQAVAQELHVTGCGYESGKRVRCVRFCDASHPARSWRRHSVTRGSAVGHRESRPESEGEKRTATTAAISRAAASEGMSSKILSMAVGKWLLCRTKKIQGLQV